MKTERLVKELERALGQLGVQVRREDGHFRSGPCTLRNEPYILLNKRHPVQIHLAVLAQCLRELPVDTVFLRPKVRAALEAAWLEHETEVPSFDDS